MAGEFSCKGDEESVVEGDYEDEHDVGDGLERGRGDVEGFGELGVHGTALLD